MQTGNINFFNYGHYDIVSLFFPFLSLLCILKVNAMIIYIYQFHEGSLADLIGHFLNTVLWKKFSMKRNICPAGTSHTYVRKMNRLFSNLWSVKAVNC